MQRLRSVLLAGLLVASAQRASADTIVIDASTPAGQAECQRITAAIAPVQLFRAPGGTDRYLRCRIVGATPTAAGTSARPQITFEAWGSTGGTYVWAGNPNFAQRQRPTQHQISLQFVKYIHHEIDSHLDLQLMLSSRDESPAAGQPPAPIGSPAWKTKMLRVLDPGGAIGVAGVRVAPQTIPAETAAELAAVTHPGWVLYRLTEDLLPVAPPSPEPTDSPAERATRTRRRLAYDSMIRARQTAYTNELQSQGSNLLHPRVVSMATPDAICALLEGVARARQPQFQFLKTCIDTEPNVPSPPNPPPAGMDLRGIGRNFEERAIIAAGFMCTLSRVKTPAAPPPPDRVRDPEGLIEPAYLRYQQFGLEARDTLLTLLEAAAEDSLAANASNPEIDGYVAERVEDPAERLAAAALLRQAGSPVDLPRPALLAVDEVEVARVGLDVIQEFERFWLREASEGRRPVRALVQLAREPAAGASSSRKVLCTEARETLVRMLRPDAKQVSQDPQELAALMRHATKFQQDLEAMFTHQDPAVRAAVQTVLVHAGVANVATDAAIDDLFALAVSENEPDAPDRDVRRATRRYAITVLTLLGVMADPNDGASPKDRATAEQVLSRLQVVRDVVESGQGTRGEGELIRLLHRLPRVVEPDLKDRVERFLSLERDHVRRRIESARSDVKRLERMVMDNGAAVEPSDTERLRRLRDDLSRLGRRYDSMTTESPSGQ